MTAITSVINYVFTGAPNRPLNTIVISVINYVFTVINTTLGAVVAHGPGGEKPTNGRNSYPGSNLMRRLHVPRRCALLELAVLLDPQHEFAVFQTRLYSEQLLAAPYSVLYCRFSVPVCGVVLGVDLGREIGDYGAGEG